MGLFSKKPKTKMAFKLIDGICLDKGTYIEVNIQDDNLMLSDARKNYVLNIKYKDITNIVYDSYREQITKNKSAVGRAVVGGVLTGGLGAIVGGMSGVGTKTKTKTLWAMYIEYLDTTAQTKNVIILEDIILVGVKKFAEQIKIKINNAPKIDAPVSNNNSNNNDIPDQILKLAELKDKNIISNEEFQIKKAELLARM
ncbi:SHOCT domain-containing protein [Clostridium botulinum]|nr:SHOCT domain-containing protein [Clostridium botulinum]NFP30973.1 SHOCT domain-containing protein [Clostridium botulinum]